MEHDTHPAWSLEELAAKANEALAGSLSNSDSRMASKMTPRNLRRMVEEGAVDAPARVGREAFYGPKHLDQVLEARGLMSNGFTAASIKKLREASQEPHARPPELGASSSFHANSLLAASEAFSYAAPTTADALAFLDGPASSGSPPLGYASNAAPARGALLSQGTSSKSWAGLSKSTARHDLAPRASISFEVEAFPGLRVSASPAPGSPALTQEQRAAALAAVEAAWNSARGSPS